MSHLSEVLVLERLKAVKFPGYSRDIVSFGLVKEVKRIQYGGVTCTRLSDMKSGKSDIFPSAQTKIQGHGVLALIHMSPTSPRTPQSKFV